MSVLRALPPRAAAYVVVVVAAYIGLVAAAALRTNWTGANLAAFALLVFGAVACVEAGVRPCWPYRQGRSSADLLGVWTLAAVALLPPFYAAAIAIPVTAHVALRVVRSPATKAVFNCAAIGVAGWAASSLLHDVLLPKVLGHQVLGGAVASGAGWTDSAGTLGVVALALAARVLINGLLVAQAISMTRLETLFAVIRQGHDFGLVATEFCMGLLVAVGMTFSPWLAVLAIPPAILLQRSMFVNELRRAATTDSKTGTATAAHWADVAEREITRSIGGGQPLSVLMIDVDHFKDVNDRYGHLLGDEVLVAVADAVTEQVRPRDVVGRFGGEEFVVLLSGSNLLDAHGAAERVRHGVASRITHGVQVTVSVGAASLGVNGHDLHELLDAADMALYAAKEAGRNRVRAAGPANQQVLDLAETPPPAALAPAIPDASGARAPGPVQRPTATEHVPADLS